MLGVVERNSTLEFEESMKRHLDHLTIVLFRSIRLHGIREYLSQDAGDIALLTRVMEKITFRNFLLAHPSSHMKLSPISEPTFFIFPQNFHSETQIAHVSKYPMILSYFPRIFIVP
jgi:hypothetical protein